VLGQTVLLKEVSGGNETINVSDLAQGMYSLLIISGSETKRTMFVKE